MMRHVLLFEGDRQAVDHGVNPEMSLAPLHPCREVVEPHHGCQAERGPVNAGFERFARSALQDWESHHGGAVCKSRARADTQYGAERYRRRECSRCPTIAAAPMRILFGSALLLAALATLSGQSAPPARIVAIGDIHGAYDEFAAILQRAGLVDSQLKWSGGRSILVQTGDYTDRGAGVRKVLDLLMRLEGEAKRAGGQLVPLLGNHEVMNLIGDWRDVTPDICAAFAPSSGSDGCLEYRQAMSPNGVYGRWLRGKNIAVVLGDTLFMHAGINPARPSASVADVNNRARSEIRRLDAYRQRLVSRRLIQATDTLQQVLNVSVTELRTATDALAAANAEGKPRPDLDVVLLRDAQDMMDIGKWSLLDPEGPLWFRGYAQWDEAGTSSQVTAFLASQKIARIVVGHSVTASRRVTTRYGGRVLLIDTGMLPLYQGQPAALEIRGTALKAIYPDGEVTLEATPATSTPAIRSR